MTPAEVAELQEWGRDTTYAAHAAGYVSSDWQPSDDVYRRLHGYFLAGLTPQDAADGIFAQHH